jgi:protein TonB
MTSNEILKADMLDILFDNRNKQYGAYVLRKYYPSRLVKALVISMSSALLFFLFIRTTGSGPGRYSSPKDDVKITQVELPKTDIKTPLPQERPRSPQPPAALQKLITRIEIVPVDKRLTETIPSIEDLTKNTVGLVNSPGLPGDLSGTSAKTTALGDRPVFDEGTSKELPVQREPEFPGGMQAWISFLSRNLRMPDDLDPGGKKMVMIRFQVGIDGSISQFEIMQSGGSYCDNEVIRVLKKMPKWKPAMQNGHSIARYFTQPVTFVGQEE